MTGKENRQIKAQKKLIDDFHHGPLFTEPTKLDADAPSKTFSEADANAQFGTKGKADINPFYGVETYSQRYAPPKRNIPQLSAVDPFDKQFFPSELWGTLEGESGEGVRKHVNRIAEKKVALMSGAPKVQAEKMRIMLDKIDAATGGKDDADMEDEEEPGEAEPEDYDFEDDEDEMGGDYDGEQYFDNGEGDSGEDDHGGNDDY